jgi:uncharacterized protein DUF3237
MLPLSSELLFTLTGRVADPVDIGVTASGHRRIVPIDGGEFDGPKLQGTVLAGGADWMVIDSDGVAHVDVRLTLQTNDGDRIYMTYRGLRHGPAAVMARLQRGELVEPSEYYFRITASFETGSKKYAWLNRILAIGVGHRLPAGPVYYIHEIL